MKHTIFARICPLILLFKTRESVVRSTKAESQTVFSEKGSQQADQYCASVNYKTSGLGKGLCELNNKTIDERSEAAEKIRDPEFNDLSMINGVS